MLFPMLLLLPTYHVILSAKQREGERRRRKDGIGDGNCTESSTEWRGCQGTGSSSAVVAATGETARTFRLADVSAKTVALIATSLTITPRVIIDGFFVRRRSFTVVVMAEELVVENGPR